MTSLMWTLAQSSSSTSSGGGAVGAVGVLLVLLLELALVVLLVAGMWKMFVKAGQPGWTAIIPLYNFYIVLKIIGRPWWWLLLMFIPIINFVVYVVVCMDLAKSFAKGIAFTIGLVLLYPIFICILGFGSAQYQGPSAA